MSVLNQSVPVWGVVVVAIVSLGIGYLLAALLGGKKSAPTPGKKKAKAVRGPASDQTIEIYVGNLSYDIDEKRLRKIFEAYGKVASVRIITNRFNGKSKGYGFVEMADRREVDAAVKALNATEINGRKVVVNEAKSQSRDK
jgi:RNA recognition motif-containing protein